MLEPCFQPKKAVSFQLTRVSFVLSFCDLHCIVERLCGWNRLGERAMSVPVFCTCQVGCHSTLRNLPLCYTFVVATCLPLHVPALVVISASCIFPLTAISHALPLLSPPPPSIVLSWFSSGSVRVKRIPPEALSVHFSISLSLHQDYQSPLLLTE